MKTRALLEGMGRLGYRVSGVSERDLGLGFAEFLRRTEGVPLGFVSTNVVRQDTGEPVFEPYLVVEAKGGAGRPPVKVGVLSVVRFNPIFLKAGPEEANLVIAQPVEMLQRYLGEVRSQAQVVVLLASIHRDDARRIAKSVPGIDVILGSYANIVTVQEELEGTTRIVYSGNQGQRIAETRFYLDPKGGIRGVVSYMHHLTARYPEDAEMLRYVGEVSQRVAAVRSPGQPAAPEGAAAEPAGSGGK